MSVTINSTKFPDANFRAYVSQQFDLDGDGILSDSELLRVTSISTASDMVNLTGIEYFTNLESLSVYDALQFRYVNFTKLIALKNIVTTHAYDFNSRDRTARYYFNLDLSANTHLQSLTILGLEPSYRIRQVLLPPSLQNIRLEKIWFDGTASLNFTNCSDIRTVVIQNTYASRLSISGLNNKRQLTDVYVIDIELTYTSTTAERQITPVDYLDFSNNERLETLILDFMNLSSSLSLDGCSRLTYLVIASCELRGSLNVSQLTTLKELFIVNNNVHELILGEQPSLMHLYTATIDSYIAINTLDVTGCPNIMRIAPATLLHSGYLRYALAYSRPLVYDPVDSRYVTVVASGQTSELHSSTVTGVNAGTYWVKSLATPGLICSSRTVLIYSPPPDLDSQLQNQVASTNGTVTFTANASGAQLAYQWQYSSNNGSSWTEINGATKLSYSFTAIKSDTGNLFRCIVSNPAGSVTTNAASITVLDPPVITSQPSLADVVANDSNVTLSITATGDDLHYQWQVSANGSTYSDITGAIARTYTLKASSSNDGQYYRCCVWNDAVTVNSSRVHLVVAYTPAITLEPVSGFVKSGVNYIFWARASGGSLTVQWQYKLPDSSTWINREATKTSILNNTGEFETEIAVPAIRSQSGYAYRCIFTNVAGSVTSNTAELTVIDPPVITAQPTLPEDVANDSVSVLSVTVTGDDLQYQWQVSSDGKNYVDVADATSSSYSVTASATTANNRYRCYIVNSVGNVTSDSAYLHVVYRPVITQPPISGTYRSGLNVELSVTADGDSLSYQWQYSSDNGSSWNSVTTAKAATYSFVAEKAHSNYRYRCVVSNIVATVNSTSAVITVKDPPSITTQPSLPADVVGNTNVTISVTAAGDDLQYQWQVSSNGSTYTNISDATSYSYSITATQGISGRYYRCEIHNVVGSILSSSVNLHVVYYPAITKQPVSDTILTGQSIVLRVEATGGGLQYQWQVSYNNGSSWQNLVDIITSSYTFTPARADNGSCYRCIVTNAAGSVTSDVANLAVLDPPFIVGQPTLPQDIIGGSTTVISVEATGDSLSYQWQISTNGSIYDEIENANSSTYSIIATASNSGNWYRCYISNAVGSVLSSSVNVHVVYQPSITKHPSSGVFRTGSGVTLSVEATGDSLQYQWQTSQNGSSFTNISDVTGANYSFSATKDYTGRQFRCIVSNIVGSVTSNTATLTILDAPAIVTQPAVADEIETGQAITLTVVATGDSLSYQWQVSSNGTTYSNISSATKSTYKVVASRNNAGYRYRCHITNQVGNVTSDSVVLNLIFLPEITSLSFPDSIIQNGQNVEFSITAIGGNLVYQWQVSVDNGESWSDLIDGAGRSTYAFDASVSQSGYMYRCVVSNPLGITISEIGVLNVLSPPAINTEPESTTTGDGDNVVLRVLASGSNVEYQWQESSDYGSTWEDISGETAYLYAFTAEASKDGYQYRCRVWNDLAFVVSSAAVLTVLTRPEIIAQPKSATVSYANTVFFSITATGGNLRYQWQYRENESGSWRNIEKDGTSDSYSFVALDTESGYQYRCYVYNSAGSVYSDIATLTVTEYVEPGQGEDEIVHEGEYLPSQMADVIRTLIVEPSNLDAVDFGNMPEDSVYNYVTNPGITNPRYYEEIAEALNNVKEYILEIEQQEPPSASDIWTGGKF